MVLTHVDMPFSVEVENAGPDEERRTFRVTARSRGGAEARTRTYELGTVSQAAYLDLFERIANDFETRSSAERHRVNGTTGARLRPLLTKNISAEVLYGYGDPGALRVREPNGGASYYVVVTSNDAPQSFPILRSRDLSAWELAGFVFPHGAKPAWTADVEQGGEFWAPEMHEVGGRFVVCFSAREKDGSLAIGLAHADDPAGPYAAAGEPLLRGGVIDPNVFVDDDGSAVLCWKQDDNDVWPGLVCALLQRDPQLIGSLFDERRDARTASLNAVLWPWTRTLSPMERFFVQQVLIAAVVANYGGFRSALEQLRAQTNDSALREELTAILTAMQTAVYAQRLDPAGERLHGERRLILTNDLPWEGHLVEGPWLMKQRGRYYLFYSGNDFSTAQYGIGVGVADSPFGPYAKTELPFIQSTSEWWGPGHPSVAEGPDGRPWMFLHAYHPGHAGYKHFRALLAVPLAFENGEVRPG